MTTRATLIAARDTLLTRGWCQGHYTNRATGEVCLAGALLTASESIEAALDGWAALEAVLPSAWRAYTSLVPLTYWNDAPDRTPEEVLNLLDQAIMHAAQAETEVSRMPACDLV